MNPMDRLVDSLIRHAARRWPVDISASVYEEWRAEVAAIRTDKRLGAVRRSRRQMSFACSLACAPSVEPAGAVVIGWRRALPAWGHAARRLALMAGIAILAEVLANVDWAIFGRPDTIHRYVIARPIIQALAVVAMAAIGGVAARSVARHEAGAWRTAVTVVLPLSLGAYVVFVATAHDDILDPILPTHATDIVATVVAWSALMIVVLAAATRIARSGRRRLAWAAAAAGALFAVDLSAFVGAARTAIDVNVPLAGAAAWLPLSLLAPGSVHFGAAIPAGHVTTVGGQSVAATSVTYTSTFVVEVVAAYAVPLLLCAGFAVPYVLRESHAVVVPVTARAQDGPSVIVGRTTRAFAAVGMTMGLVVWAAATAGHLPWEYNEYLAPLRVAAMVLVVSGLAVLTAGRGTAMVAASAVLAMLAAEVVVERSHWVGTGVAAALCAFGVIALAAARTLAGRVTGIAGTRAAARRALLTVATTAALAVPTGVSISDIYADRSPIPIPGGGWTMPTTPPVPVSVATVLVATLLAAVAFTAALASRGTPLPTGTTMKLGIATLAVLAVGIVDGKATASALYWPTPRFFVQPVLVVVVLAAACWRPGFAPVRSPITWFVAGIGAAVMSVPLSQPVLSVVSVTSDWLMTVEDAPGAFAMGTLYPAGAALVGLAVGVVAAHRIIPPEDPVRVDPVPPPDPALGRSAVRTRLVTA